MKWTPRGNTRLKHLNKCYVPVDARYLAQNNKDCVRHPVGFINLSQELLDSLNLSPIPTAYHMSKLSSRHIITHIVSRSISVYTKINCNILTYTAICVTRSTIYQLNLNYMLYGVHIQCMWLKLLFAEGTSYDLLTLNCLVHHYMLSTTISHTHTHLPTCYKMPTSLSTRENLCIFL